MFGMLYTYMLINYQLRAFLFWTLFNINISIYVNESLFLTIFLFQIHLNLSVLISLMTTFGHTIDSVVFIFY